MDNICKTYIFLLSDADKKPLQFIVKVSKRW